MLRTPAMGERQRVFVFPDSDVHTKILAMPADRLWEGRDGWASISASARPMSARSSRR